MPINKSWIADFTFYNAKHESVEGGKKISKGYSKLRGVICKKNLNRFNDLMTRLVIEIK